MAKRETGWAPTMEQHARLEGRQVKCLIASAGHLWMQHYYDQLPRAVRQRLAASPQHLSGLHGRSDARRQRSGGEPKPSIATYFTVIAQIERKLR
jgi:hypothetical protein